MNKLLLIFFLISSTTIYGQSNQETIEFGILPSEYGEGMPPHEFLDIEEQIIATIKRIPRFKILKTQEDYYDMEFGEDWMAQIEEIRKQGVQTNVPYLLQIVFGDTEWHSETVEIVKVKAVVKEGKETVPAKTQKFWTHRAAIWVTLNLYKVETGELEESLTFNTQPPRKKPSNVATKRKAIWDFKTAVEHAKPALMYQVNSKIHKLAPFKVRVLNPIDQSDKAVNTIAVSAGSFHGLKVDQKLYVYYEHEHLINGEIVIREISAGSLVVEEVKEKTAICKVKKGSKKIKKLIAEGKELKCGYKDFYGWADGYGF